MSSTVLFVAGAFISFITLWGVVMASGLYVTRHQPPDGEVPEIALAGERVNEAVMTAAQRSVDPDIPARFTAS